MFLSIAKRVSDSTSSRLRPSRITALSLIRSKPAAIAASMPFRTASRWPIRVIAWKRDGSRLSRLILTELTPASRSWGACAASWLPLVVRASVSKSGRLPRPVNNSSTPRRISGSPPVTRILRTPSSVNSRAVLTSSSIVSTCARGRNSMVSAIQYWHRKSQRSVTERRR